MNTNSEMRINDAELSIIKNTFAGNIELLKLMRKIFLPEISAKAPLGGQIDLWMAVKVDGVSPEEALINLKARNTLISHVETCLQMLNVLAGQKTETVEQTKTRLKKDSSK
jgi:hypothetical protein